MTRPTRAFEPWMLSNLVSGAVMCAFVVLLLPPFITQTTGSAARVGVVFAVMSLAALLGPWFGRLADRFGLHRWIYVGSFVGLALSFVILALDSGGDVYSPLAGILLGASMAAKGVVGTAYLVGSGLAPEVQARQLTVFNLIIFGGQVIGGAMVALLHVAGASFTVQFWAAAALIAVGAGYTWLTTGTPDRRMRGGGDAASAHGLVSTGAGLQNDPEPAAMHRGADAAPRPSLRRIVFSTIGALMAFMALGAIGLSVLSSQIANILPSVFGVNAAATSVLVAVAGLLGIPAVIVTGTWLVHAGPLPPLRLSGWVRAAGFVALAVLGLFAGGVACAIAASVVYLCLAVTGSIQRSPLPRAVALIAPIGVGEANGFVSAAAAVGAFVGCLAGGIVAQAFSYEALLWFGAVPCAIALVLLPSLRRAIRAASV